VGVRTLLRTNMFPDPRATAAFLTSNNMGFRIGRWFGGGPGTGTHTFLTNRLDGPIPAITTYLRKEWTVTPSGTGDTGFDIAPGATIIVNNQGWPVTPGDVWTFSVYLRASRSGVGPFNFDFFWHSADGTYLSRTQNLQNNPTTEWQRFTATITVPVDAAFVGIVADVDGVSPIWQPGDYMDITGGMCTAGPDLVDWFDGSSMETRDRFYKWNGMVNGSTSNEYWVGQNDNDAISGGASLARLKQRLMEIVLGPNPVRVSEDSKADIKKAALEKLLGDNGLI